MCLATAEGPRGGSATLVGNSVSQHEFNCQQRQAAIQRREAVYFGLRVEKIKLQTEIHYLCEQLAAWEFWWNSYGSSLPSLLNDGVDEVASYVSLEQVCNLHEFLVVETVQPEVSVVVNGFVDFLALELLTGMASAQFPSVAGAVITTDRNNMSSWPRAPQCSVLWWHSARQEML